MRVITGTARGRRLESLSGLSTRPTADRVKEGVFSAIQFDVEGRRVLDLFAGTGQMGIEALSRGAAFCDFVDSAPAALKVVQRNLKTCGLEDRAACHGKDFSAFLSRTRERYGVVFLDPPYASGNLDRALELIAAIDIVVENGIIVCESLAEHQLPELPGPYEKGREYRYGKIKCTLYRRRA
ncbi:MAG: 16S rRNA (guanine(966)-N(2))-methyltransferase RsmD [Oscillospiraceae bacterium]|nr:16S rRNA (guanine(966)-N(2))-methyltransferase RsmD [Oscillospiraceae bacterium]MDE6841688.1 16S rRNA (guanine(966)-N(2))-methyltransferase RsmD [Oscillospiraceae bacterium]